MFLGWGKGGCGLAVLLFPDILYNERRSGGPSFDRINPGELAGFWHVLKKGL
jgi:hypothetical protein